MVNCKECKFCYTELDGDYTDRYGSFELVDACEELVCGKKLLKFDIHKEINCKSFKPKENSF